MRGHALLTIAVPTYNRCDKLAELGKRFLLPVSKLPGIEVLVCDNSEPEEAERNARIFSGSSIRYQKNSINVGFHGNLLQCISKATGDWLWIISDDDDVDRLAFIRFFSALSTDYFGSCRGVILPFYMGGRKGGVTISEKNKGKDGGETLLNLVLRTKRVPFVLFSSVVVRIKRIKNRSFLSDIFNLYSDNDYTHVFLFSKIIGRGGLVCFWGEPIQTYCHAYEGRFPLKGMIRSMDEVLRFMEIELCIDQSIVEAMRRKYMHGWAIWYAWHRSGTVKIQEADEAKFFLFKRALLSANLKAIMLLFLVSAFPKPIVRRAWMRLLS